MNYERMFNAAIESLAQISVALEIPPEVAECANGNQEMLDAIARLKISDEMRDLRTAQAREVMPLIGPMLDAYEGVPNDRRDDEDLSDLFEHLSAINQAIRGSEK